MTKKKIAVLISGFGSNLQSLIDACAASDFPADIVRVISSKDNVYGLKRAEEAKIAASVIDHKEFPNREAFDEALHHEIMASGAEFICLAGFMRLLTPGFVNKWLGKIINIHPALLPSFKGIHTHEQALAAGVKIHGCTVHHVIPEMDSGPIIVQGAVPVLANDTAETLGKRVLALEHVIYPLALRRVLVPQLAAPHTLVHGEDFLIS